MRSRLSLALVTLFACGHAEPPQWDGAAPNVAPLPAAESKAPPAASHSPPAPPSAATPAAADAGATTGAPAASPTAALPENFATLPQTRDRPPSASPALESRARALFDGIVQDDPERAMPFFFPVGAYQQVKAIAHPENDWKHRLVGAYARDLHAHAKRLGTNRSRAVFARLDVPEGRARWVEPNEEGNKLGYYRVYGARLVFTIDGKEEAIDLTSLISWRGEWFCVHLSGFK